MFSYQAQHSPRKYTDGFVKWLLLDKHTENPKFFQEARDMIKEFAKQSA